MDVGAGVRDLEDLYRRQYERFARVAAAVAGDVEAGHDAVQEGFASLLRGREAFRGEAPLEAWAWRAVLNAARKARARRLETVDDVGEVAAGDGMVGDGAIVRGWVAALPERQRLAVSCATTPTLTTGRLRRPWMSRSAPSRRP